LRWELRERLGSSETFLGVSEGLDSKRTDAPPTVDADEVIETTQGTPQGGNLSPIDMVFPVINHKWQGLSKNADKRGFYPFFL